MTTAVFQPTVTVSDDICRFTFASDWFDCLVAIDDNDIRPVPLTEEDVAYLAHALDSRLDQIRAAIVAAAGFRAAFDEAADGPYADDEHAAAVEMGDALLALCDLIEPFFKKGTI